LNIKFFNEGIKTRILERKKIGDWIQKVANNEGFNIGSINIIFCSDFYLLELNKRFLSHNYLTDIITFQDNKPGIISGDIFISINRIKENAVKYKVSEKVEIRRVVIHGILHLIGYNDNNLREKRIIREKENQYLSLI
jgi:probable rRNA maturation factor